MIKLKYLILLSVSGCVIAADQLTKQLIIQRFFLGESLPVLPGFFNLTYVHNPGAAFGIFARLDPSIRVPFFIIMPVVALGVIGYVFRKLEDQALLLSLALSLVIGGAIGNLIDRATYNYVIDFLDFHFRNQAHFPAFNIADSAICVGVGILILDTIRKGKQETHASNTI